MRCDRGFIARASSFAVCSVASKDSRTGPGDE
jgi:hypothetical protein